MSTLKNKLDIIITILEQNIVLIITLFKSTVLQIYKWRFHWRRVHKDVMPFLVRIEQGSYRQTHYLGLSSILAFLAYAFAS